MPVDGLCAGEEASQLLIVPAERLFEVFKPKVEPLQFSLQPVVVVELVPELSDCSGRDRS